MLELQLTFREIAMTYEEYEILVSATELEFSGNS